MKCPDNAGCQDTALCCGPLDKEAEAQLTARQQAKAEKLTRLTTNTEQRSLIQRIRSQKDIISFAVQALQHSQ